jgi:hypothetical protein
MRELIRALCVSLVASSIAACGVTGNFRMDPGYARFESPGPRDAERTFGLSLGPLPLRIARLITSGDPELSQLLKGLKGVRVYVYAVEGDASFVRERIEQTRARLVDQGWDAVVAVRDDGEFASALVRTNDAEDVRGIVVMTHDDEEVVLVNVIGRIRPESFGALMGHVGYEGPPVGIDAP